MEQAGQVECGLERPANWRVIVKCTFREAGDDNLGMLSAGVAFYAFLAFVPTLGATVLTYGLLADPADVGRHLQTIFHLLPADAAKLVGDQIVSVTKVSAGKTGLGLAFALLLALYGAMNGAGSIITALNMIHNEDEARSWLTKTILTVGITIGLVLIGVTGILAMSALAFLESLMPTTDGALISAIRGGFCLAAAATASGIVTAIYRYAPNHPHPRWTKLMPGAFIATIAWLAMTLGFSLYVANVAHYNATYGALSAVIALLMWLYLSAYIFLLGAELNSELR